LIITITPKNQNKAAMKTRRQVNNIESAAASDVEDERDAAATAPPPSHAFAFNGKTFATYQEMVDAKRRRNRDVLVSSGLLEAKAAVDRAASEEKQRRSASGTSIRGLKRAAAARKSSSDPPASRRKSGRLAGVTAPGIYIESEQAGKFEIAGGGSIRMEPEKPTHYNNRINDGSDLSVSEAVELTGSKWVKEGTVESAEHFMKTTLPDVIDDLPIVSIGKKRRGGSVSPTSVARAPGAGKKKFPLQGQLDSLSLDDPDTCVAKVTPERIYSVACHPSPERIIACAGDKTGHLGIWNVDQYGVPDGGGDEVSEESKASSSSTDGVHLFRPHRGAISCLEWNASGTTLLSASYDGSVRAFDANKQVFEEIFATYDDSTEYETKLGYGTDRGYNSWIQSMALDSRHEGGKCLFLSTSQGGVMHVDLRSRGKITFDRELSPKKINTVSLHPNGHSMATAGLSGVVQLWDVRQMPSSSDGSKKQPKPLAWQPVGRSINSAFFSPTGGRLVTTTMSDKLEILEDFHMSTGLTQPKTDIRHNNQTGRWLSTLMARWHPALDDREIFVVGSMQQPRTIEVFASNGELLREIRGDALTAVASRCCFHPNPDRLVVVGGNSSGRVTVAR